MLSPNRNTMLTGIKFTFNRLMRKSIILLISIATVVSSASFAGNDDRLLVAVSILPQVEFVKNVGGSRVGVIVMIPPGASPTTYELTPGQMKRLSRADLYAKVGTRLPFEQVWLDKISDLNPDMPIIDCSSGIEILGGASHNSQTVKNDAHHEHGQDLHIWSSPRNAKKMVDNIAAGLANIDPTNKSYYMQNAAAYKSVLDDLDREIIQLFSETAGKRFMILHPAWGYFARDYGLTQMSIEAEGKEPKASNLKNLIKSAKAEGFDVIFASPQFNPESAKIIADEIGAKIVFIDPLAENYVDNMRAVAKKLAQAMK